MPWKKSTLDAVCAGLRQSAENGQFVPRTWIEDTPGPGGPGGSVAVNGCGWGLVGWFVATMHGGPEWARYALPAGCDQEDVNEVLTTAGLTEQEIARMEPQVAWEVFDNQLDFAYENRFRDWQAYIQKSMLLAEYFISVLKRVPVESAVPNELLTQSAGCSLGQLTLFNPQAPKATTKPKPAALVAEAA
jgi:hypothetical protein